MKILDGNKLSQKISVTLKNKVNEMKKREQRAPSLVILQAFEDSASDIYVKKKLEYALKIGVDCRNIKFPKNASEKEIIEMIKALNKDKKVNGIILQLPIRKNLDERKIINTIDSHKDVDGLCDKNLGKILAGDESGFTPATAKGIIKLLKENNIKISGKRVVVLGRSRLVGKPTALCFINENATVTICHSKSKNIDKILKNAEIIVSATGKHGVVNKKIINKDQIVVDVGISLVGGKIKGDVDLSMDEIKKLEALSPVPGGVGPMTVACLFENLIEAYQLKN